MQTEDANNENRTTLIGIVSGGIGCGLGIPAWYTRVSFHFKWIRCVVYYSALYNNNQKKVVEACKNTVQSEPTCVQETDLVFGRRVFCVVASRGCVLSVLVQVWDVCGPWNPDVATKRDVRKVTSFRRTSDFGPDL